MADEVPVPEFEAEWPPELRERCFAAAHAMQSGVATMLAMGNIGGCTAKHLRVGVNSAMVDFGVIARLLIAKGVFTAEEFFTELAEGMEAEQRSYEKELGVKLA